MIVIDRLYGGAKILLIDIGFKSEGVVSRSEFNDLPEINQEVDVS